MEKRILIIDDDSDIVTIIQGAISGTCKNIDSANSLEEALKLININSYSLIFLDLNLDFKNGDEIISILDNAPTNPNKKTPIVVVSGLVTKQFLEQYPNRFAGIINKPFSESELKEIANKILK